MKRITALIFAAGLLLSVPAALHAEGIAPIITPNSTGINDGSFLTAPITGNCSGGTSGTCHAERGLIEPLFLKIGGLLTLLAGILAVFSIVINGIRYTTSGGDQAKTKTARSGIIAALVGVVISILAYTFIHFAQVAGGFISTL